MCAVARSPVESTRIEMLQGFNCCSGSGVLNYGELNFTCAPPCKAGHTEGKEEPQTRNPKPETLNPKPNPHPEVYQVRKHATLNRLSSRPSSTWKTDTGTHRVEAKPCIEAPRLMPANPQAETEAPTCPSSRNRPGSVRNMNHARLDTGTSKHLLRALFFSTGTEFVRSL